jgi:hypothetical protein
MSIFWLGLLRWLFPDLSQPLADRQPPANRLNWGTPLRQLGAKNVQTADAYLEQVYVPHWNRRFSCEPRMAGDTNRARLPGMNLDSVLSIRESRTMGQDQTVRWHGMICRMERKHIKAACAELVCRWRDD